MFYICCYKIVKIMEFILGILIIVGAAAGQMTANRLSLTDSEYDIAFLGLSILGMLLGPLMWLIYLVIANK